MNNSRIISTPMLSIWNLQVLVGSLLELRNICSSDSDLTVVETRWMPYQCCKNFHTGSIASLCRILKLYWSFSSFYVKDAQRWRENTEEFMLTFVFLFQLSLMKVLKVRVWCILLKMCENWAKLVDVIFHRLIYSSGIMWMKGEILWWSRKKNGNFEGYPRILKKYTFVMKYWTWEYEEILG